MKISKTIRYAASVTMLAATLGMITLATGASVQATASAGSAATAVAATAATPIDVGTQGWGDCTPQSYRLCTFVANDFNGSSAYLLWSNHGSGWTPDLSSRWDVHDQISSISNNSSEYWCFYEHAYYGGARLEVAPYAQVPNLDWKYMNDRISSFRPGRC
jgi:hypothetical protein